MPIPIRITNDFHETTVRVAQVSEQGTLRNSYSIEPGQSSPPLLVEETDVLKVTDDPHIVRSNPFAKHSGLGTDEVPSILDARHMVNE